MKQRRRRIKGGGRSRRRAGLTGRRRPGIDPRLAARRPGRPGGTGMTRRAVLLVAAVLAGGPSGCVERRYVIESDPPGALVLVNGQPLGTTPVDGYFTYYGSYTFTLIKDGYQTKQ